MNSLKEINACFLQEQLSDEILNGLALKFKLIMDDISANQFTPRVLSIGALQALIKSSDLFSDTLLAVDPTLIYSLSSLSLLNVDFDKKTVSFLLAIPMLYKTPEYIKINILPVPTPALINDIETDLKLTFDSQELVLPVEFFKGKNFTLNDLNYEWPNPLGMLSNQLENFLQKFSTSVRRNGKMLGWTGKRQRRRPGHV